MTKRKPTEQHRSARSVQIRPFLVIGLLFSLAGGAWLLFGVPFEDPRQDWVSRGILFIGGLFLVVLSRKIK